MNRSITKLLCKQSTPACQGEMIPSEYSVSGSWFLQAKRVWSRKRLPQPEKGPSKEHPSTHLYYLPKDGQTAQEPVLELLAVLAAFL